MNGGAAFLKRYSGYIESIDPHNKVAGCARSILATGTLLTFIFTPMDALFYQSSNYPAEIVCSTTHSNLSLFCASPPHDSPWAYIITYVVLWSVIIGFLPFLTSLLHFWIAWSFGVSSPMLDGGDQIAWALSIIFVILHFGDLRITHWASRKSYASLPSIVKAIWWAAIPLFILQATVVYLHASIGKLFVEEWVNGTDVWYWLNDPTFAPPFFVREILLFISNYTVGTIALNYSVLILEFILAIGFLLRDQLRIKLFFIGVLLHVVFAVCFGLWSFLFSMISLLILCYLYSISLLRKAVLKNYYELAKTCMLNRKPKMFRRL